MTLRSENKQVSYISLNEPTYLSNDDEATILDTIADDFDMDEDIVQSDRCDLLYKAISMLNKKEQLLVEYYYFKNKSQNEISKLLGKSQAQVSRDLGNIVIKLRNIMKYLERS